jgi:hypothetical protein
MWRACRSDAILAKAEGDLGARVQRCLALRMMICSCPCSQTGPAAWCSLAVLVLPALPRVRFGAAFLQQLCMLPPQVSAGRSWLARPVPGGCLVSLALLCCLSWLCCLRCVGGTGLCGDSSAAVGASLVMLSCCRACGAIRLRLLCAAFLQSALCSSCLAQPCRFARPPPELLWP